MANQTEHTAESILSEIKESIKYSAAVVSGAVEALKESKISEQFGGKIPGTVELHAVTYAIYSAMKDNNPNLDQEKLVKGLIIEALLFRHDILKKYGERVTFLDELSKSFETRMKGGNEDA